jgi:betaine-aldehyde dehydrogenase
MESYLMVIDGQDAQALSGRTFVTENPAISAPLAEIAQGGAEDVDLAVKAARRAFDSGPWARMQASARATVLFRLAALIRENLEDLARSETLNIGKPIQDSRGEIGAGANCFEYYAGAVTKLMGETIPVSGEGFDFTLREPIGVVAAIVPWNFPFPMACWKCAPALAAGNAVILKPASYSPITALKLGRLAREAGVPDGIFNVITGPGSSMGHALVTHPGVDKISFTGETTTGAGILKASADDIKRVSLELGGKSPNIVFADSDVEKAARSSVLAVFGNAGQDCCARSRAFVEKSVYDKFVEAFIDETSKAVFGDPMDDATQIGPLVSMKQRKTVCGYIDIGREEGATLAFGGDIPSGAPYDQGSYLRPAVFTDVRNAMKHCQEEIFGPVVSVIPFTDEETMLSEVNDSPYGLSGSIWTRNLDRAIRTVRRVKSGVLSVNTNSSVYVEAPFGGYKKSGIGRDLGMHGLMNFTEVKNVFIAIGGKG